MTLNEYENLKVGDWVRFINVDIIIKISCIPLLDGKPHKIVRAGMEAGYFRIGFDEVKHNSCYKIGWCYDNSIKYMTKVNPPSEYDIDYIQLDIQKEIDICIPKE